MTILMCDNCKKVLEQDENVKFENRTYLSFYNHNVHFCIECAKKITFYEWASRHIEARRQKKSEMKETQHD